MRIATAEQMRKLDERTINERGILSTDLMQHAAAALTAAVQILLAGKKDPLVVCFCGAGNNGGDGVAAGRIMLERGMNVRCFLVGKREKMTSDCRTMEEKLVDAGGYLEDYLPGDQDQIRICNEADVIVDAIFGIGLNSELRGDALSAVKLINDSPAKVVSADLPSGVEADTGCVLGDAVRARITVTFTLPKAGCWVSRGAVCSGRVMVADIGIPADLIDAEDYPVRTVERADVSLPRRERDTHKGDYGRIYMLSGSMEFTGAPVLAARAAVRAGAGMVSLGVPQPAWSAISAKLVSAMPHPLPADKEGRLSLEAAPLAMERMEACGVALIGPGLGRSGGVTAVVRRLLHEYHGAIVLDADGINALEGHIDLLDERRGSLTVLTPHDKEFERMGGDLTSGDRLGVARAFAVKYGCCLVLKGYRTITAFPDGTAWINTTGNPGLAKGGSGDVLTGIIVALLGQGLPARRAVPMGVWIHGAVADLVAERLGEYGMAPTDVVEMIPQVTKNLVEDD